MRRGSIDFTIRKATMEDYEGICDVLAKASVLHSRALPHVFRHIDRPLLTREEVCKIIAYDDEALLVAEKAEHIIGVAWITLRQASDIPVLTPRRYAVINELAIAEGLRRSGIGRSLMQMAHKWARSKEVSEVELNVWEFNKGALAFYEELGYITASRKMWRSLK